VRRQGFTLGAFGKDKKRPSKTRGNFCELDADGLGFVAVDYGLAVANDTA